MFELFSRSSQFLDQRLLQLSQRVIIPRIMPSRKGNRSIRFRFSLLTVLLTGAFVCVFTGARASQAPSPNAVSQPTFYRDVLPVLQTHCQSCHRVGGIAPMPLETYEQAKKWAGNIVRMVNS